MGEDQKYVLVVPPELEMTAKQAAECAGLEVRAAEHIPADPPKPMTDREALAFVEETLAGAVEASFPGLEEQIAATEKGSIEREDCETLLRVSKQMLAGMLADVKLLREPPRMVMASSDMTAAVQAYARRLGGVQS